MATENFLADYQNILLRHVIVPGSHDAGLAGDSYGGLGMKGTGKARTVTQKDGVGTQAQNGSRFFDVRIIKSGGSLKAYHSPKDTRAIGGVGQGFSTILDELRDFVKGHRTEFVIVRLAHLKDSKEVFQELANWIGQNDQYVYKGTGNLANKFVRELAGKLILLIEGKKLAVKKFHSKDAIKANKGSAELLKVPGQSDGFHTLYQNKQGKALPDVRDGLCICGEFANSKDLEKIVSTQAENYSLHDKHRTHADDKVHLYCLYWTSTGGNIEDNTRKMHDSQNFQKVRAMVADKTGGTVSALDKQGVPLKQTSQWSKALNAENAARAACAVYSCSLPNIILYDFVNKDTSREIIGLNGLVPCKA